MNEIITERSGSVVRVQFNRPAKKNAITSAMYVALAEVLETAAKDDGTRVLLLHGAGDSFTAGNDLEDFARNPPGPGDSPQMRLFAARVRSPEAKEAFDAFFHKRRPDFTKFKTTAPIAKS